jgi:DNA sulfur modification protein DndD
MILHKVALHNFGIYGGDVSFDLTPHGSGVSLAEGGEPFQRPVILFRGKNGVGKSTLAEAIRLCLHGKLSLGGRTRQRDYELYLRQRLHRDEDGETAVSAYILLEFAHVLLGRRQQYRVKRAWGVHGRRLTTELHIWIDGEEMDESDDEKEYLLRELIPAGVAELFFFDGEKIATLSEEGAGSADLLADTVKNLLGLHLVEQLDRDLDIYLTRQTGVQALQSYQTELTQLHDEETKLAQQRREVHAQLVDCRRQLNRKREDSSLLEAKIAREGGRYAEKQTAQEAERQKIAESIAQVEQEIQELSRGVMPFSVAPNLLRAVQTRLKQEADYERWQAAQPVLQEIEGIIKETGPVYYVDSVATVPREPEQDTLVTTLQELLQNYSQPPMPEDEIVHNVSGEERGVLLNWIDEALTTAPRQLAAALQKRRALHAQLKTVDETLSRVPVMQILRPLQDQLRQLDREVGHLEAEQERLIAEDGRLAYHLERIAGSKRRVSEQIAGINTDEHRIKLAARTKLLLGDYQKRLTERKLAQLAAQLRQRFNQLSRKRNFLERISIDPETFGMTLYRAGKPFPRTQLSAGEEQMFAIAVLWALREVSGRPLPVIIDTPLSRLDEDHRRAILAEFMPQAAQQVIVLATTAEIDEATFAFLQPVVSRAYLLEAEAAARAVEQLPTVQFIPTASLSV